MDAALRALVRQRAGEACEYCQMPQAYDPAGFEIDHIIAEKHHGPTNAENLAFACFPCNVHKGPNISGYDLVTRDVVALFHPRTQSWAAHFAWRGATLVGRTPTGRATVDVLRINLTHRIEHRQALMDEGVFAAADERTV